MAVQKRVHWNSKAARAAGRSGKAINRWTPGATKTSLGGRRGTVWTGPPGHFTRSGAFVTKHKGYNALHAKRSGHKQGGGSGSRSDAARKAWQTRRGF
jgi:hypothetical protein